MRNALAGCEDGPCTAIGHERTLTAAGIASSTAPRRTAKL